MSTTDLFSSLKDSFKKIWGEDLSLSAFEDLVNEDDPSDKEFDDPPYFPLLDDSVKVSDSFRIRKNNC